MTAKFVSETTFLAGLIIVIIASIVISAVVSTQLVTGIQGPEGPQGLQGVEGPTGLPGILNPDYDSGWVETNDQIELEFTHNLETSDVFVYVLSKWYREWEGSGGPMVHQFYYGGDWHGDPEKMQGFHWNCYTENPNMIHISQYGGRADEVRVLIWKLPTP